MNIPRMPLSICLILALLALGSGLGSSVRQQADRKVVFEEIGQFNDGGMAVTVLMAANLAYVCEFDNGLEILDIRDPSNPVKIGSFFDGGRPNGLQLVGNLAYVADGSDGLEIIRFRKDGGRNSE